MKPAPRFTVISTCLGGEWLGEKHFERRIKRPVFLDLNTCTKLSDISKTIHGASLLSFLPADVKRIFMIFYFRITDVWGPFGGYSLFRLVSK